MATRTVEHEVKLEADLDFRLPDFLGVAGPGLRLADQTLQTAYFDTPDYRLWNRGITLRHRLQDDSDGVWTLKLPDGQVGGTLARTEYEWSGGRDAVPPHATCVLRGIIRRSELRHVTELVTERRRTAYELRRDIVELDDDTVTVMDAGHAVRRFRQLKLEIKSGDTRLPTLLTRRLVAAGAHPDVTPKLAKALRLPPQRPLPQVGPDATVGEVIRGRITLAFEQLLDHDYRAATRSIEASRGRHPPSTSRNQASSLRLQRLRGPRSTPADASTPATSSGAPPASSARSAISTSSALHTPGRDRPERRPRRRRDRGVAPRAARGNSDACQLERSEALASHRYIDLLGRLEAASISRLLLGPATLTGRGRDRAEPDALQGRPAPSRPTPVPGLAAAGPPHRLEPERHRPAPDEDQGGEAASIHG